MGLDRLAGRGDLAKKGLGRLDKPPIRTNYNGVVLDFDSVGLLGSRNPSFRC